jgi:hypothetical protein
MMMKKARSVRMAASVIIAICALCILHGRVFCEDQHVTIIMEKAEYDAGEKVAATADFNGVIYAWSGGCWSIQKWADGVWSTIARNGCISQPSCKEVKPNKSEPCACRSCDQACWYETQLSDPHRHAYAQWVWDQEYEIARKTYGCAMAGSVQNDECIVYGQAPAGRYKIRFEYASSIDKNDIFKKDGIAVNYVEKEFIIHQP